MCRADSEPWAESGPGVKVWLGLGALFFLAFFLMSLFWENGGILAEMAKYVADIAACVVFWEAITILVVENKERRDGAKRLLKRFHSISFDLAEEEGSGVEVEGEKK